MSIDSSPTVLTGGPSLEGWRSFEIHKDSTFGVPSGHGLIRTSAEDGTWQEIVVLNVEDWLNLMRDDLRERELAGEGLKVEWWAPPAPVLNARISDRQGKRVALRPGRPLILASQTDWTKVPSEWGLYRIHRQADDTWYVGISSNVRTRLRTHRRNEMFDLDSGDVVEVIPAKEPTEHGVITWSDLQEAEAEHIARMRGRGCKVKNITKGGNGQPPMVRFNGFKDASLALASGRGSPLREPRRRHIDLCVTWNGRTRDRGLWLRYDGVLCAVPDGDHGDTSVEGPRVSASWLREHYTRRHGRDLDEDLRAYGWTGILNEELPMLLWEGLRQRNDKGESFISPSELLEVTPQQIRARELPSSLSDLGFVVDEQFRVANSLNNVMRVTAPERTGVFLKTEENRHAVRSEVLVW